VDGEKERADIRKAYVTLGPVTVVAFHNGLGKFVAALRTPEASFALRLSLIVAGPAAAACAVGWLAAATDDDDAIAAQMPAAATARVATPTLTRVRDMLYLQDSKALAHGYRPP